MNLTEKQIEEFNKYYQAACKAQKGVIILGGYRPKSIGFLGKWKANKAIANFEKALSIYPESFESLFFLGKIYQRLGNYKKSLEYMETALKFEYQNHNLPQEASLVAMHLNQIDKAIALSKEAIRRKPNDFVLLGNHAMNLLIAGVDEDAKETINKAMAINPNDAINKKIKSKIESVVAGKAKRPTFTEALG